MSDTMVARRITVRLDEELARKVQHARKRTGKSTTDLVREGLDRYCTDLSAGAGSPWEVIQAVGLVGCASGPSDLAETYKDEMRGSLGDKL